jgi:hypothetical protein
MAFYYPPLDTALNDGNSTTTHSYPQEEVAAMMGFYGGRRCAAHRMLPNFKWAHMLEFKHLAGIPAALLALCSD